MPEETNDLGYKGTYMVPMQILGRKIMHELVILEHVQDNILGIDFIKQHAMSYNSLNQKCFWETPQLGNRQQSQCSPDVKWTSSHTS